MPSLQQLNMDESDVSLLVSPVSNVAAKQEDYDEDSLELDAVSLELDTVVSPIPQVSSPGFGKTQVSTPFLGKTDSSSPPPSERTVQNEIIKGSTTNEDARTGNVAASDDNQRTPSALPRGAERNSPIMYDEDVVNASSSPRVEQDFHSRTDLGQTELSAISCRSESGPDEQRTPGVADNTISTEEESQSSNDKCHLAATDEQSNKVWEEDVTAQPSRNDAEPVTELNEGTVEPINVKGDSLSHDRATIDSESEADKKNTYTSTANPFDSKNSPGDAQLSEVKRTSHEVDLDKSPLLGSNIGSDSPKKVVSTNLLSSSIPENGDTLSILSPLPSGTRSRHRQSPGISGAPSIHRDLSSAKKKLDATSVAFIERLQGAARRRKLQVTRSRDSLAAKEKQQLLTIASSKQKSPSPTNRRESHGDNHIRVNSVVTSTPNPFKPFKALPLPETTGRMGHGGQFGVPKVTKKPATTPFSPPLGPRRQDKVRIKALDPPNWKKDSFRRHSMHSTLKCRESDQVRPGPKTALPGPPTRLLSGTEASSSKERALQERLRQKESELKKKREFRARPLPRFTRDDSLHSLSTTGSSPGLLGLELLNKQSKDSEDQSMDDNAENRPPSDDRGEKIRHSDVTAYHPYSSTRAEKRAEFEAQRAEKEKENKSKRKKLRQSLVQQIQTELDELRDELR